MITEQVAEDIEFLCFSLKKFLNYAEFGCACADECDEITGECAENPQCTGEFQDQAIEACPEVIERVRLFLRENTEVLARAS